MTDTPQLPKRPDEMTTEEALTYLFPQPVADELRRIGRQTEAKAEARRRSPPQASS